MQETPVQLLGREDPLEKGTTTHSNILAWRISWTVESMGSIDPWLDPWKESDTTEQLSLKLKKFPFLDGKIDHKHSCLDFFLNVQYSWEIIG